MINTHLKLLGIGLVCYTLIQITGLALITGHWKLWNGTLRAVWNTAEIAVLRLWAQRQLAGFYRYEQAHRIL